MLRYLLASVLCLFSFPVFAQSSHVSKKVTFSDYYSVSEVPQVAEQDQSPASLDPLKTLQNFISDEGFFSELKIQVYDLLKLDHHNVTFGDTNESYSRIKHFGTWIHDSRDHDCYNTRAKVLIRDSQVPVDFTSTGCSVKSGRWLDPYTGGQYADAGDIQIDHFVPLKNAFISGAWKWDYKKRCLYANFLGNTFHLLSVLGKENMRKSDRGPEGYMPPSNQYQCQYVEQWLKVKLIWQLGLNPDETQAVQKIVQSSHCNLNDFKVSVADLQGQRRFMLDNANLCN